MEPGCSQPRMPKEKVIQRSNDSQIRPHLRPRRACAGAAPIDGGAAMIEILSQTKEQLVVTHYVEQPKGIDDTFCY